MVPVGWKFYGDDTKTTTVGGDWNHGIWLDFPYWEFSSSQLTNSVIFQDGRYTTNQCCSVDGLDPSQKNGIIQLVQEFHYMNGMNNYSHNYRGISKWK